MSNCKILDCTIRDGGYVNDWKFTKEQVRNCYIASSKAGCDFMEIGFRNKKTSELLSKFGDTQFCTEEYINEVVENIDGCKIAIMVTINKFDFNDFVNAKDSKISLVRVLMDYHGGKDKNDDELDINTLIDGIEQINRLSDMGYEISFNIGRIDKINKNQLYEVCKLISTTKTKYFTMADTYGSVDLDYIEKLIPYVKFLFEDVFLNKNIEIGFHAHDNCSNGTEKALHSLKYGATIIDGTSLGYGRGSGNAKLELMMMNLNKNYGKNYNFIDIIQFGDNNLINYKDCKNNMCYNVIYALTSYFGAHVTYGIDIIEKLDKIDTKVIYKILEKLTKNKKQMFHNPKLFNQYLEELNF